MQATVASINTRNGQTPAARGACRRVKRRIGLCQDGRWDLKGPGEIEPFKSAEVGFAGFGALPIEKFGDL